VVRLLNGANQHLYTVVVQTTGVIALRNPAGLVASTQNPVILAEAAHHYELLCNITSGIFKLYIDSALVMDLSGISTTNAGPIAQLGFVTGVNNSLPAGTTGYLTDLIVRNTTGTYNNAIMGDRRVATLMVNSDDLANQGWTARPIQRFGTGVLAHPTGNGGLSCAATTDTSLGNGDFTLESQVRFYALPTGTQIAHIAGKWQADNNNRSWRLYKAGPSVDNGMLVFQISTTGASGGVVTLLQWPWTPNIGEWYHVAVSRVSGQIRLFINGIMQGLPVADANTYFAATATTALMTQRDNGGAVANTGMLGWLDEFRLTKGVGRYTANFAPPTAAFPRNVGGDPSFASVVWLSGFDSGLLDESSFARALSTFGAQVPTADQPGDLAGNFLTINKRTPPYERSFIEAALIPATGLLTLSANPTNGETVTVGVKTGPAAAVYTFKTALASAFDVLIGVDVDASLNNLVAAILKAAGEGTTYGTGTTVNLSVSAAKMPTPQMAVTALIPGTAGNSIASTETLANGSWGAATLQGGADIPAFSQFGFERPPNNTTIIDSVTLVQRAWKTDSGPASLRQSFVGPAGAVDDGAVWAVTTAPTLYFDMFEEDPDTNAPVTPTTIVNGKVKINRTA
jgi:hypothetical protein